MMRPSVVHVTDTELPRTATRKVKRPEVRKFITRLENAATALKKVSGAGTSAVVREAVASIARIDASKVRPELNLVNDLGFDSLMVAELATALESRMPHASPDQVAEITTVADLEGLLNAEHTPVRHRTAQIEKEEDDDSITVPEVVKDALRPVAIETQFSFYRNVMRTKVTGRGFIPQNRQVLVIANHASHLDAGLVKYALGNYGKEVVSLAAQDYFFSDKWRRLYFENFTHMAPLDRKSGLRKALRQAGDLLDGGRSVLIFPEGTRSTDGNMAPFMPLIGHLAINHHVDILPIYLDGTYKALPKGAKIPVPRTRKLAARIGPPLRHQDLAELTQGQKRVAVYREVAKLAQEAVEALRDGSVVDLQERVRSDEPVAPRKSALTVLMEDLERKFVPGAVDKQTSFYFSLGTTDDAKWTLIFDAEKAHIRPGKPEGGSADCVLKTNRDIFTRIVRESYTPSVAEFMSGQVKSNDIGLLQVFQKAFDL